MLYRLMIYDMGEIHRFVLHKDVYMLCKSKLL